MPKSRALAYAMKLRAKESNEILRKHLENRNKVYLHGVGICTKNTPASQKQENSK